jgi:serine/threonine protein kinase
MNPNFFSKIPKSNDSPTGFILLDEYAPLEMLGEGGMGQVFLVRSISTGSQFAVKRAKYVNDANRKNFLAELQTWINLPVHPNLVACRFFRTFGDEILIFADYVEGGSLKDWIDSRKLYEGGPDVALERMFDVAIQLAWGLHCVHELGAIHQDIKPGNVLMASNGVANSYGIRPQITDFGLARARAMAGEDFDPNGSILVSSIRGTPAYWSPEQSQGMPITHKADIWSWGLSVIEMFTGGLTWMSGLGAAEVLEQYREQDEYDDGIPILPVDIACLLKECFSQDPLERPISLACTVEKLQEIYQDWFGFQYARTLDVIDKPAALLNGSNERRTRTGGVWANPEIWLGEALSAAGRDSGEAASIVARHGATRMSGLVADIAIYDEAKRIFENLVRHGNNTLKPNLARLCMNKGHVHQTAGDVRGALSDYNRAIDILKEISEESGDVELSIEMVHAFVTRAHILNDYTADHVAAFDSYKRASDALEFLVYKHGRIDLESNLASIYSSMAGSSALLGNNQEAIEIIDKALAIGEKLVNQAGRRDLAGALAINYMNKSIAVHSLGDNFGAIALCSQSILILEQLITGEEHSDLEDDLAHVYAIMASYVAAQGDIQEALVLYDKALAIQERLVDQEGRKELSNDLAWIYESKADIASQLGDKSEAMELYDKAIAIQEKLINQDGRKELANSLAVTYANKAKFARSLGNACEALALYDKAIAIQNRLINNDGRNQLSNDLACTYSNKADAARDLGDNNGAMALYDKSIKIRERLVNQEGKIELADDLATDYTIKAEVASELGEFKEALDAYNHALYIREELIARNAGIDLTGDLAMIYTNIGIVLNALEEGEQAITMFEKAIAIQDPLVNTHGLTEILGDLAISKGYHGLLLLNYGEVEQVEQALSEIEYSLKTLQDEYSRNGRIELKDACDLLAYNFSEFMNAE